MASPPHARRHAYSLAGTDLMQLIATLNPNDNPNDDDMLLRRLLPFLVAGLQAPLPELSLQRDPTS